ncbi:MAG: caspase family protein, partial [Acidobacteriota bacterium]
MSPTLHALLIGISAYPPVDQGRGPRDQSLEGPINDVVAMYDYLRRLPRPVEIHRLTATADGKGGTWESSDQLPTMRRIDDAIQSMIALPPDRPVLIHFAGHGARLPSVVHRRKTGFDECLVPYDHDQGRYLRDFELAYRLRQLSASGRRVVLVLDCCFSGGLVHRQTRSRRRIRGLGRLPDPIERGHDLQTIEPLDVLLRHWNAHEDAPRPERRFRDLSGYLDWLETSELTAFAAARSHETARETLFGECVHGQLTYWLLDGLEREPAATDRALYEHARVQIGARSSLQHPVLTGVRDSPLFQHGEGRAEVPRFFTVLKVENGSVWIDGGQAHGLEEGQRVRARTRADEFVDLELTVLYSVSSELRPIKEAQTTISALTSGDRADPVSLARRVSVAIETERALVSAVEQTQSPFVHLTDPDRAEWRVELRDNGSFAVLEGETLIHEEKATRSLDRAADIQTCLDHLARYRNLGRLRSPGGRNLDLGHLVRAGFHLLAPDFDPEQPVGVTRHEAGEEHVTVETGQWLALRIENLSGAP